MSLRFAALLGVLSSCATLAPTLAAAPVEEVHEIATKAIQRIDGAELLDCAETERDRFPGVTLVCGSFRGNFSALKFQLENNLSLQEFRPMVIPRDAWTLRRGEYSRELDVLGRDVVFRFEEAAGLLTLAIGEALPAPKKKPEKKADEPSEESPPVDQTAEDPEGSEEKKDDSPTDLAERERRSGSAR